MIPIGIFWVVNNDVFKNRGYLKGELEDLKYKATYIKIPEKFGSDNLVEYTIHPSAGNFGDIDMVERDRPEHIGSSGTIRSKYIDMSVVRQLGKYWKVLWTIMPSVKR